MNEPPKSQAQMQRTPGKQTDLSTFTLCVCGVRLGFQRVAFIIKKAFYALCSVSHTLEIVF